MKILDFLDFQEKKCYILPAVEKVNLKRNAISGMSSYLSGLGLKSYRPSQIARWIYQKGAESFVEMTDMSKEEREMR